MIPNKLKMINILACTFALNFFITLASTNDPEVTVDQGSLKGYLRKSWKGKTFKAFTGIPYAEPPTGELRFQAPVPGRPWNGTLDATKQHAICPQMNIFFKDYNIQGNEDCLFLNVFTPQLSITEKRIFPVMFFIHGGGFTFGTANTDLYGPDFLMDKDIVLVTSNYRVGALGFLSTGDDVVPGNAGLKDQNLALKWTKKNIAQFGGDPDKITIFGQSAGGASTHYHVVSPLSRDLIKGAIIQSGTTIAPWALGSKEHTALNLRKLATFLNCPTDSSHNTVECLKKIDTHDIVAQDLKFMEWSYDPAIPFRPVIEPTHEGAFLTEDPIDIISSCKSAEIPIISGIVTDDGALRSAGLYDKPQLIEKLDNDFNVLAPLTLMYDESLADKDNVSMHIRDFYFGNHKIDDTTKSEVTQMYTDSWFLLPEDSLIRLHLKCTKQPMYYFLFGYRGSASISTLLGDPSHDYGAAHCDDLIYLFNSPAYGDFYVPTDSDKKMTDLMTTLWTNFAKVGNPTPETDSIIPVKWEPVQSDKLEYYFIKGPSDITMNDSLYPENVNFWRNIPFSSRSKKLEKL